MSTILQFHIMSATLQLHIACGFLIPFIMLKSGWQQMPFCHALFLVLLLMKCCHQTYTNILWLHAFHTGHRVLLEVRPLWPCPTLSLNMSFSSGPRALIKPTVFPAFCRCNKSVSTYGTISNALLSIVTGEYEDIPVQVTKILNFDHASQHEGCSPVFTGDSKSDADVSFRVAFPDFT